MSKLTEAEVREVANNCVPLGYLHVPLARVCNDWLRLYAENEQLKAKHSEFHKRAQDAERAMADLLKCNEILASGKAWCAGSLGRAFLAYRVSQLEAERDQLRADLAMIEDIIRRAREPQQENNP